MPKSKRQTSQRKPRSRGGKNNTARNIDANKQDSHLRESVSDSLTWNLSSEAIPRFGRTMRFDNRIFNVVQMGAPASLFTTSVTVVSAGVFTFTATNSVSQFSSWSAVFDQYRIMEIEVWISADLPTASNVFVGAQNLYSVIDYDDGSNLSTVAQALAYENVIAGPMNNGHYRKWRPHIATAAYSGVFTSFKNEVSPWIDVASPGVQHYGIKCIADVTVAVQNIKMLTRVWIQFRNVF